MGRREPFPFENLPHRVSPVGQEVEGTVIAAGWNETSRGVAGNRNSQRSCLQRCRKLLDQSPRPLKGNLRALREHRAAVLIDALEVEALFGFLKHDVLGG